MEHDHHQHQHEHQHHHHSPTQQQQQQQMDVVGDGLDDCPMIMTFHGGHCERILFDSWMASTVTQFVISAFVIFLVAFGLEALKFARFYLLKYTNKKEANYRAKKRQERNDIVVSTTIPARASSNTPLTDKFENESFFGRITSPSHLVQTVFKVIQIIISYLLMLIFMTFNYWLCLAVVLGLSLGYLLFGWIKQDMFDDDCCH
ncbi:high affinity copper uptake protein 1-like [Teleopsis dalmanni]|uniref:high affinity copper uptake protein 1-like n=1 Tax=Teleopsis dalmanni TaxID=139649 RepID=UPI0018CDACF2|nr:high affinity copper uptake protein 1-like [Teleopsis dalmanni]